ncbi:zinc protease [Pseudomonas flavescens]|uniref:Zinc protease n=1 Tax=Phytopseudomonas flavescens TaxID=29435 RepID=A0A1G8E4J0_9GAMM|nr:M16 family metallopeptidase [Pseudomonas flavescens]SDH64660.1 zinc protease [Pseudomonas flavescens]
MHTLNLFFVALAALLLGACAHTPADDAPLRWHPIVSRGELPNGLRYNLIPIDTQKGRLDLRLTVHAGSVDEADDQVGVAHLLEHLAFYSHGDATPDVRQRLQQAGWQQGRHFNAVTHYERTQYLLSPPDGTASAELALEALATLAFAGDFTADDLQRERPIVIEEWRGGLGVAQRMNAKRTAAQRTGSRYPGHRTIGNRQAIEAARLDALQAFQQRWYRPSNMVLNLVGDFDPKHMAEQIERHFGQAQRGERPSREHLELPLDTRLKVFRVQDSQSGSNQVALLMRFRKLDIREQTLAGGRDRLLDRLALSALSRYLRRQPLEEGIGSLTAVKTQIGRRTGVLAVAASVKGQHHEQALQTLLRELQRLRQHGLHDEDVAAAKGEVRQIAERMLAKPTPRDFDAWVRQLNDATLGERVLQEPEAIARNTRINLDRIDKRELQQRIVGWLDSPDRVLQLSAPGGVQLKLPDAERVEQQVQHLAAMHLEAPAPPAVQQEVSIPDLHGGTPTGSIETRRRFAREKVEQWQLSNGDRLVWLRARGADGKAQLRVDSSAGFLYQGAQSWRAQIANQLALQMPPPGWTDEQLKAWKQRETVQLSFTQGPQRLEAQGSAAVDKLGSLLALYQARQTRRDLDEAAYRESISELRDSLLRRRDNVRSEQEATWRSVKQGQDDWQEPNAQELDALERSTLEAQWRRQAAAPVTYYLMADLPERELEVLVNRHLAGIPRGEPLISTAKPRQPGQRQASLAIAREPRASLYAGSFQPHPWSPADAARVAALREIANDLLKQRLRGEAAGIYSLKFDSELSPEHQRIDSELRFSSDPQRADELWQLARQTLSALPDSIDEKRVAALRRELTRQEALRVKDPAIQFNRLILSERAWHDPRYLSEQHQLPAALEPKALKRLARQVFPASNEVRLLMLPAQDVGS